MIVNTEILSKAAKIRLLALDSDGVLTDGGVYIDDAGREFRRFDIKDGLGLKRVMEAGIHVAIISTSKSEPVVHRARNLGISEVHIGIEDKLTCLTQICRRLGLTMQEVAYMGDDLLDIPVMRHVGLSCAPRNATPEVQAEVMLVSPQNGGYGATRYICDLFISLEKTERS